MIFTMVAVAISGYLLIESAPDFSNYALLSRSQELDDGLTQLRGSIGSVPATMYTTLGDVTDLNDPGVDKELPSKEEFLLARLESLRISGEGTEGAPARPPRGANGSERASYLATVPSDPYIPRLQWYDPSTQQGLYWSRSYNMVRNPCFAGAAYREAYVESSFDVLFCVVSSNRGQIYKTGPLGVPRPETSLPLGDPATDDIREPRVSPDGVRFLYLKRRVGAPGAGYYVWSANIDSFGSIGERSGDGQFQVRITTETQQIYDTPRWGPLGDKVLYRNTVANNFEIKGLTEKTRAYKFPSSSTAERPNRVSSPSWSPSGQYVAFIARVGGQNRLAIQDFTSFVERWGRLGGDDPADQKGQDDSSRLIDPAGVRAFGSSKATYPAQPVAPVWSPDSTLCVYVMDNGQIGLVDITNRSVRALPSSGSAPGFLSWLPASVQGGADTTSSWLLVARNQGDASRRGIFRRRLERDGTEYPSADQATAPEAVSMTDPTSVAVSSAGTRVAFPSPDGRRLNILQTDGADRGFGRLLPIYVASAGSRVEAPSFSPPRAYWAYPVANVTLLDSGQIGRFDPNTWREFLMANQDFEGDTKFGSQWLRVEPAARADNVLFDNGKSTFLISRIDPTKASYMGDNIEPCWSPRAQTWVGREAAAPIPTDRPVNLFKVPFNKGSATTVRITTGLEPAISPDDRLIVVSKNRNPTTTFPPDRTLFPIENMDLESANTAGSVDPPDRNLTPETGSSQEREPAWSPDGKFVYYQREIQEANSLAQHGSSIYRVTRDGAVQTEVQDMVDLSQPRQGFEDEYISGLSTRIEFYSPAVSPDGTRLAFIGRQRLRASRDQLGQSGDIISEALYVKDLVLQGPPKQILRFGHPKHPGVLPDGDGMMWSLDSPCWSPNGEELLVLRYRDINGLGNSKFPRTSIYNWDPNGNGKPYYQDTHDSSGNGGDGFQEVLRVAAADPVYLKKNQGKTARDVLRRNFDVVISTVPNDPAYAQLGSLSKQETRIFHPRYAPGSVAMQRILYGEPQTTIVGVPSGDVWYVLSGFVRTSPGAQDVHAAQIMLQVLDGNGLLVDLGGADEPVFQVGVVDVGAVTWTRFSQAINFGSVKNPGPLTLNLLLYAVGGVGSYADFTGLKLERAHDTEKLYPTRFSGPWTLFTPNRDSDPRVPDGAFFER